MSTDERGFTLAEVLVAMVICTVGLVSLAELTAITLRLQQLGRNSTEAIRMAQDKIDELTMMSFESAAQVACGGSITADAADHNDVPTRTVDDVEVPLGYKRRWLIEAGPDGDTNLRQVTVRVIPDVSDRRTASPVDMVTIIRGTLGVGC